MVRQQRKQAMGGIEREYAYKPRWTLIVFCAVLFGLVAVILGAKAYGNDRGVIINRVIELSPSGATTFYWVLCACSVGFVTIAAFLACHRLIFRQRIAFSPTALLVPASRWSSAEQQIGYRDIQVLSRVQVSGQRFLYVTHSGGQYAITASMLPSKAVCEEVCELLASKVRALRPAGSA
jgi:hypothetical protein